MFSCGINEAFQIDIKSNNNITCVTPIINPSVKLDADITSETFNYMGQIQQLLKINNKKKILH